MLLKFVASQKGGLATELDIEELDSERITAFLQMLEENRGWIIRMQHKKLKVNKNVTYYDNEIIDIFQNNGFDQSPEEILKLLFRSYSGNNALSQKFYAASRTHVSFAMDYINGNYPRQDLLPKLNTYLMQTPIDRKGDFYGLLIAYFKKYKDFYDFKNFSKLRKDFYIPAHLLNSFKNEDLIDRLLLNLNSDDVKIKLKSMSLLTKLQIPKSKHKVVKATLLPYLSSEEAFMLLYINSILANHAAKILSSLELDPNTEAVLLKYLMNRLMINPTEKLVLQALLEVKIPDADKDQLFNILSLGRWIEENSAAWTLLLKVSSERKVQEYKNNRIEYTVKRLKDLSRLYLSEDEDTLWSVSSLLYAITRFKLPLETSETLATILVKLFKRITDFHEERLITDISTRLTGLSLQSENIHSIVISTLMEIVSGNTNNLPALLLLGKLGLEKDQLQLVSTTLLNKITSQLSEITTSRELIIILNALPQINISPPILEQIKKILMVSADTLMTNPSENMKTYPLLTRIFNVLAKTNLSQHEINHYIPVMLKCFESNKMGMMSAFKEIKLPADKREAVTSVLFASLIPFDNIDLTLEVLKLPLMPHEYNQLANLALDQLKLTTDPYQASNITRLLIGIYRDRKIQESVGLEVYLENLANQKPELMEMEIISKLIELKTVNTVKLQVTEQLTQDVVRHINTFTK